MVGSRWVRWFPRFSFCFDGLWFLSFIFLGEFSWFHLGFGSELM